MYFVERKLLVNCDEQNEFGNLRQKGKMSQSDRVIFRKGFFLPDLFIHNAARKDESISIGDSMF